MPADVIEQLKGGLIVSCQAEEGEPFYAPESMARFAKSAELGGAVGVRAKEPDIRAIREICSLPIIGIDKVYVEGFEVYITPGFQDAQRIAAAGASIIALDCTPRPRPGGVTMEELVQRIKSELKLPVMADISTVEEALAAEKAGADIVATTLSGYTAYSKRGDGPDWPLLDAIVRAVKVPVIAEGGIATPAAARRALDMGAWAVVIGSAITRPIDLTKRFVSALPQE
ncbi:MAG: N-acetylmannosamine-6-phosphate 2-epimerase [Armatimonadota bacterium]|nr:MAG: N-acetylmannosamine-6-phosphate 2-epimerase [Armatimonadota bacterium]